MKKSILVIFLFLLSSCSNSYILIEGNYDEGLECGAFGEANRNFENYLKNIEQENWKFVYYDRGYSQYDPFIFFEKVNSSYNNSELKSQCARLNYDLKYAISSGNFENCNRLPEKTFGTQTYMSSGPNGGSESEYFVDLRNICKFRITIDKIFEQEEFNCEVISNYDLNKYCKKIKEI